MKTRLVEEIKPARRGPRSKYQRHVRVIEESLEGNGADDRFRALVGTEKWHARRQKSTSLGIREHFKRHPVAGCRLSLRLCAVNGLVFRWTKIGR